jgi:hypothetical protein
VTNAVFEYFAAPSGDKGKFTLSNLDPTKRYSLTFFGSRKYPAGEMAGSDDTRTTVYSVTDSNGVVQVSTNLRVGVFGDHNSNTVASLANLSPDLHNRLFVEFGGLTSTNSGYLNCLKIEVLDPPAPPAADQSVLIDFGNDSSYNGAAVVNPDGNGNYWNSVWSGAFYADLVDAANQATPVDVGFDADGGTDSFNGPAGAVNAAALGSLGGATNAVNDYYVDRQLPDPGPQPLPHLRASPSSAPTSSARMTPRCTRSTRTAPTRQLVARASLNVQVPGTPGLHNSNTVVTLAEPRAPVRATSCIVKVAGNAGADRRLPQRPPHRRPRARPHLRGVVHQLPLAGRPAGGRRPDDGLANLAEFGLGGNPTNDADTGYAPSFTLANFRWLQRAALRLRAPQPAPAG